jgi:signal transduction histidine kinase
MARLGRVRVSRERLAFGLTLAIVVAAEAVFVLANFYDNTGTELARWHAQAATAILLVGVAYRLRRRPGLASAILVMAGLSLRDDLESAWAVAASLSSWSDPRAVARPEFLLSSLPVLAGRTIPTLVVALYATAPERRLGRWSTAAVWLLTSGTVLAAVARPAYEAGTWPPQSFGDWWYGGGGPFSWLADFNLLLTVAVVGMLGALRHEARLHVPSPAVTTGSRTSFVPDRSTIIAVVGALGVWLPAAFALLTRPADIELDSNDVRLAWLPILLILVGFVASRWSHVASWLAIAGALQTEAVLLTFRAAAEYVATVPPEATSLVYPPPPGFWVFLGATFVVQVIAFAATALAVRAAWQDDPPAGERTWAIRGALVGILAIAWYIGTAVVTTGFPWSIDLALLPAWPPFALILGIAVWRRLVPAVAEAEAVATRPLQPLRYLETVVSEAISGGAQHRRRAVEAERARLASTLHAEFLPNLERLASRNASGASREEVTERLHELQDEVRRLMAERRLVVLEEFGIVEALEWLVAQAEDRVPFAVELTVDDASTPDRPPREVERAAFRIAQLAVENAIQHAGPSRLALHVLARGDRLTISVADDGRWVAPSATDRRRDHVGIADMRSEADQVRGAVEVRPSLDGGTTVQFGWPAVAPAAARTGKPSPAVGGAG